MKKTIFLMLFAVGTAAIFNSCSDEAVALDGNESLDGSANLKANKASSSTTDIFDPYTGLVWGKSTLRRNSKGVTVNFKAKGLMPGHAYTLWTVVWNSPENCAAYPGLCADADFANADQVKVEVMYVAGHVVDIDGIGNFSGRIMENDTSGSINDLLELPSAGGLLDAQTAEVHFVLRSHGPAIPGMVNQQISSYLGGCSVDLGVFTGEIPDEPGECGDILASEHQAQ